MPGTDRTIIGDVGDSPSCCGERSCALYRHYSKHEPRPMLIPTLDGLRLSKYHASVPVSLLEWASPGEKLAIGWYDQAFVSPLVPRKFIRYVLVHFYHDSRRWTVEPPEFLRLLTPGPSKYRSILVEASLARFELGPDAYRDYWDWRRTVCRLNFFRRSLRTMMGVQRRIDRLAEFWDRIEIAPGVSSVDEISKPPGDPHYLFFRSRSYAISSLDRNPASPVLS